MSPLLSELLTELKVDPHGIRPDALLEEAGLDSLTLAELSMLLDERGVKIGQDELAAAATLQDLDDTLTRSIPAR